MAFGLGILRLSPRDFWRMTPLELDAASQGVFGLRRPGPGRADLSRLMQLFPDTKPERKD